MGDNMEKPTKMKNKKGYIRIILLAALLMISVRAIAGIRSNALETALVEHGSISIYEKVSGIVVREERIIKAAISGYVTYIAKENIRVPVNEKLLEIKSDRIDASLTEEYNEINKRLQALEQMDNSIQAAVDDDTINTSLSSIGLLIDRGDLAAVYQEKERLNREISYSIAANTTQAEREELIREKERLDQMIEGGIKDELSPFSGVPVYSLDGYEEIFYPGNMQEIIPSKVQPESAKKIDLTKELTAGEPVLKIVDNHVWYLVCDVSEEFGEGLKQNSSISLEVLDGSSYTTGARVNSIHQQEGGYKVIFESGDFFPGLYEKRVVDLNVIKEKHSGYLIPLIALIEKDGEYEVEVVEAEKIINKKVIIKGEDGINAVVESADAGPELKVYDMVILRN